MRHFPPKKNQAKTYNDLCRSRTLSIFGVTSVPSLPAFVTLCIVLMYVQVHYYYYYFYYQSIICIYVQDPARLFEKKPDDSALLPYEGLNKAPDYDRIIYTGKTGYVSYAVLNQTTY